MRKCIINTRSGKSLVLYFSDEEIRQAGKVQYLVFEKIPSSEIKRIYVRCFNSVTKKHFLKVTYDAYLENARSLGNRLEVTYRWNEKERFLVGKSTGWIPIYIALKRVDSSGGGGILVKSIKHYRVI